MEEKIERYTKKKRRIRWKNVFLTFLFIVFLCLFIYSLFFIIKWKQDSNKTNNVINSLDDIAKVVEVEDNENVEIIENDAKEDDPYWDYIKMNLIDVDFDELRLKNQSTVGWIKVNGTNINYPFVQTTNNDYYLNHTFDKSHNSAGWVFMDYRNNIYDFDTNTIIYAHGRLDNTMFGSLRKILTSGWLNNKDNYVIKLSTEYENTLWQVFSVYKIPTTNDYIQIDFINSNEYLDFLNMIKDRSKFDFNTSINENDKILTLSTCYDDYNKVVLHAKLIKREKKS